MFAELSRDLIVGVSCLARTRATSLPTEYGTKIKGLELNYHLRALHPQITNEQINHDHFMNTTMFNNGST